MNHVVGESNPRFLQVFTGFGTAGQSILKVFGFQSHSQDFREEIALIKLAPALSVPVDSSVPIWTGDLASLEGAKFYSLGYGISGQNDSVTQPILRTANLRFNGFCQVNADVDKDSICDAQNYPAPGAGNSTKPMLEFLPGPNDSLPCAGDSGGPVLAKIGRKVYLVGLAATTVLPKGREVQTVSEHCLQADVFRAVHVSLFSQWIAKQANDASIKFSNGTPQ